jgi:hypothetical protein
MIGREDPKNVVDLDECSRPNEIRRLVFPGDRDSDEPHAAIREMVLGIREDHITLSGSEISSPGQTSSKEMNPMLLRSLPQSASSRIRLS